MSGYPHSEREHRYSHCDLQRFVTAIFERCGMTESDAALLTHTLVVADLRGCHSHGVLRVPEYTHKLLNAGVDPRGRPRVARDRAAAMVIDGGNSMGQISGAFAMKQAIRRARQCGVAVAAVRGSNHCGALAYFAMMALEQGMIGLATTNALPTMAPWGGVDKIVGINPLSVAIPAQNEDPIVIDAAFSASSHGKIRVYHQKGLPLPEGWALDPQGKPTTDPTVAIEGLLRPIGDYKGVGLAIVMGVLSTALSGARYGTDLGNMVDGPKPGCDGQFLLALDIAAFTDRSEFGHRIDRVVHQIRSSRRARGCDKIYIPGELEASTELQYRAEGIPLNETTIKNLHSCARNLGIETSLTLRSISQAKAAI